jgi:hypothetical protein
MGKKNATERKVISTDRKNHAFGTAIVERLSHNQAARCFLQTPATREPRDCRLKLYGEAIAGLFIRCRFHAIVQDMVFLRRPSGWSLLP